MNDICLVFPNRRAGVFFISYLQDEIENTIIGPKTITVGELISDYSELHQGEKLQLISILFDVFKKHTQTSETFDEFFFWGEILLADFNDVDRYLVNAKDIFRNVSDIKEIESFFDYLTPEQKKALEHFWGSVAVDGRKGFQQKHITIWEKLYPVYAEFKEILIEKKLAYSGMTDRQVVESLEDGTLETSFKKYYIIGLNALNACEKKFFRHLQKQDKAAFLWDFDEFYLNDFNHEAGRFMRNNLKEFPPPSDFEMNTKFFEKKKNIKMVAVSSNYGQAQQISNFIDETRPDFFQEFDNTAIVLADEALLFSSLGAIPLNIGTVNVTMGYPVKNSMIHGFLMLLINLLKNTKTDEKRGFIAYHRFVTDILNHQLFVHWETKKTKAFLDEINFRNLITVPLAQIDFSKLHQLIFSVPVKVENYNVYFLEILGEIYRKLNNQELDNKMLLEIIYSIYQAIEKLESVLNVALHEEKREISNAVYFRLLAQYLGSVSVAFEGEPLSGVQVMGILETRCLDFKNLIILGLNENKWPRTYTAPSFIPGNIRKGFGLPGIDEQDAMYSYYFYRLIQRAKNVTATYNVIKEGISTGELSRYGFQLQYDSVHRAEMVNLDFYFANDPVKPIEILSSQKVVEKLLANNTNEHPLSPSAINLYLMCRLRFYFRYIMGLPEPDEVKEEIDGMMFGNIFHDTIEALYKPFVGKLLDRGDIEKIKKNRIRIENEIHKNIAKNYFREKEGSGTPVILEGKTLLISENMKTYLYQLLKIDANFAPFSLVSLEKQYAASLDINLNGKTFSIKIGGKVDRVDRLKGKTRIIDYKTGNVKSLTFKVIDELFKQGAKDPKKEILQALIYTWALSENSSETDFQPAIYSLRNLFVNPFDPRIQYNKKEFSFHEVKGEFISQLKQLIHEIYSSDNIFSQTPQVENCKYCPYREICQRY